MLRFRLVVIPPAAGEFVVFQLDRAYPLRIDAEPPPEALHRVDQAAADDEDLLVKKAQRGDDLKRVFDGCSQ